MKKNNSKKIIKLSLGSLLARLLLVFCLIIFFSKMMNKREKDLIQRGNQIVKEIENYRKYHRRLPNTLSEIGFGEYDTTESSDSFYYDMINDSAYTISFMVSIDYNKFYYSDTKQWEDGYREIK